MSAAISFGSPNYVGCCWLLVAAAVAIAAAVPTTAANVSTNTSNQASKVVVIHQFIRL